MKKARIKLRGLPVKEANVDPKEGTVQLDGKSYRVDKLPWDVPVSGTVYGTLLNYKGALAALGDQVNAAPYHAPPQAPVLYIKPANTFVGCGMPIPIPEEVSEVEIGAALGIVIGRTATRVSEDDAIEYVAGYTIVNDVTVPHTSVYRPAVKHRARDGFCPLGPWVIDRDAVPDPNRLGVRVHINGELQQENSTANLIRSVQRLISDVTDFMTLNPGDTLHVGVPEGAPLAKAGDVVRIEIDEIGVLENRLLPEHEVATGVTL